MSHELAPQARSPYTVYPGVDTRHPGLSYELSAVNHGLSHGQLTIDNGQPVSAL